MINARQIVIKSEEKSDVILEMENRFRPVGLGSSEIIYMHLYPNRWDFVNHNREYRQVVIYSRCTTES